ncbi:hypothetical protein BGZ76_011785 [Entomortierella beljakovae]|nr:hypothetical protein BGZ76_011785 [Entomortierella beljakovae]
MLPSIHHLVDKEIINNQNETESSASDLPSTPMLTITHTTKFEELKSSVFVDLDDTNKIPNSQHTYPPQYSSGQSGSVKDERLSPSMKIYNISTSSTPQGAQPSKNLSVVDGYSSEHSDLGDSTKKRRRPISPQSSTRASPYGEVEIKREPGTFENQMASVWQTSSSTSQPIASQHRSQQRTSPPSSSSPSTSPSPNSTATAASTPLTSDTVAAVIKGTASTTIQDTRSRSTSNQIFSRTIARADYKENYVDQYMVSADLMDRGNLHHTDIYSPTRGGLVQSISRSQERPVMSFRNLPHSAKQRSTELMAKRRSTEASEQDRSDGRINESWQSPLNSYTRQTPTSVPNNHPSTSPTSPHGSKFASKVTYRVEKSPNNWPDMNQHERYRHEDTGAQNREYEPLLGQPHPQSAALHPSHHRHHSSGSSPNQQRYSPSPQHEFVHESDHRYTHRPLSKAPEYLAYPPQEQELEQPHQLYRRRYSGDGFSSDSPRSRHSFFQDQDQMIRPSRLSPPEFAPSYRPLYPKTHLSGRHDTPGHTSGHQARHHAEPIHPYPQYSSLRDQQMKQKDHTNVIDLEIDYNEGYSHKSSSKMGGSEGALQHPRTSTLQWKDSHRGIRHSVSESDLQSVETDKRINALNQVKFNDDDDPRMSDDKEVESEAIYEGDYGFSEYEKLKSTSAPRMSYEEYYGSRHSRDIQAQPESRRPMFMNQREPHPYDSLSLQHGQYHSPRQSHAYSQSSSHEQYPSSHTSSISHNTPQLSSLLHNSIQHQHQQHPSSDHHTSPSTFMDQNLTQPPKAPGPNRRGPYLSRQRAIMAGLEPSTSSSRYQCQYCQKRFSRPSSLRIHTYSHTGERPFKCSEEGCGRQFSVQSNMRRHLRVHRLGRMRSDFPQQDCE